MSTQQMREAMRIVEGAGAAEEYRGEHRAPGKDSGAPLHDLTSSGTYPKDVYTHARYYFNSDEPAERDSANMAMSYRGHPNRPVTIYRAVPKSVKGGINPGDWVSLSRRYCTEHGHGSLRGDFRIQKKTVYARDVFTNGDSFAEWGYDPQPFDQEAERALRQRRADKIAAMSDDERAAHDAKMARVRQITDA